MSTQAFTAHKSEEFERSHLKLRRVAAMSVVLALFSSGCRAGAQGQQGSAVDAILVPNKHRFVYLPAGRDRESHGFVVDATSWKIVHRLPRPGLNMCVAFDDLSDRMVILDEANTVSVFDVGKERPRSGFQIPTLDGLLPKNLYNRPLSLEVLDGQRLFAASMSSDPGVWSVAGELLVDLSFSPRAPLMAATVDRRGARVALGDAMGRIVVRSLKDGKTLAGPIEVRRCTYLLGTPPEFLEGKSVAVRGGVFAFAWSPDGRYLAIGPGQAKLIVWEVDKGPQALREFSYADDDLFGGQAIGGVAFSPDSKFVYAIAFDVYQLRAWDVDVPGTRPLWDFYRLGNAMPMLPIVSRDGLRVFHPTNGHVLDSRNGKVLAELGKELDSEKSSVFGGNDEFVWARARDSLHVYELADLGNHVEIPLIQ